MKRFLFMVSMMFVLSSFVLAVSSEISTSFVVGAPSGKVVDYVPSGNVWGNYFGYFVLAIILVALIYFIKAKKVSKTKKVSKAKKVSKKVKKRK